MKGSCGRETISPMSARGDVARGNDCRAPQRYPGRSSGTCVGLAGESIGCPRATRWGSATSAGRSQRDGYTEEINGRVLLVCLVLRARQRVVAGTRGDIEAVAIRTAGLGGCSSPVPHVRFGFISRPARAAGLKIRALTRARHLRMPLRRGPRSGGWAR